ncbi:MAG: cytidine deaminase [Bacteroidetes bacterium]|nr:cytidine deaminase [Bacteroidota bacterium]
MKKKEHKFSFEVYDSIRELNREDAALLEEAKKITVNAYAPYSRFRVGAVAILASGERISGSNQENASFPAGICAERVLLSVASSLYPGVPIKTIAISYIDDNGKNKSDHPISPCGICRQSLLEFESRTKQPIRLILGGAKGKVFIIPEANALLPLAFTSEELK